MEEIASSVERFWRYANWIECVGEAGFDVVHD